MKGKVCSVCNFRNVQGAVYCGKCSEDISEISITDIDNIDKKEVQSSGLKSGEESEISSKEDTGIPAPLYIICIIILLSFYTYNRHPEIKKLLCKTTEFCSSDANKGNQKWENVITKGVTKEKPKVVINNQEPSFQNVGRKQFIDNMIQALQDEFRNNPEKILTEGEKRHLITAYANHLIRSLTKLEIQAMKVTEGIDPGMPDSTYLRIHAQGSMRDVFKRF